MTRWILVHGDSDGVVCGALAYAFYGRGNVYFTHPAGLLEDLSVVKPGDSVFVGDIALSEPEAREVLEKLSLLAEKGEVVYVDHHPLPEGISKSDVPGTFVHALDASASELTYKLFQEKLPPEGERLALFGAIGNYLDQTPWVKRAMENWDKRCIYFEAGVLAQGLENSRRMHDFKRHVVKHLASWRLPSDVSELLVRALVETVNEEEMRLFVKQNVQRLAHVAYVVDPPGSVARAATYARAIAEKPVGVAVELRKKQAVMSLRSVDPAVDLNELLRKLAKEFGGTGGGHPNAAGARVPLEKFNLFLEVLDEEVGMRLAWKGGPGSRR